MSIENCVMLRNYERPVLVTCIIDYKFDFFIKTLIYNDCCCVWTQMSAERESQSSSNSSSSSQESSSESQSSEESTEKKENKN